MKRLKVYIFSSKDFVLKTTQSHTVEMIASMSRLEKITRKYKKKVIIIKSFSMFKQLRQLKSKALSALLFNLVRELVSPL